MDNTCNKIRGERGGMGGVGQDAYGYSKPSITDTLYTDEHINVNTNIDIIVFYPRHIQYRRNKIGFGHDIYMYV
jgi:hypothetical protein